MERKSKILIGLVAVFLVVLPLTSTVMAANANNQGTDGSDTVDCERIRFEVQNLQRPRGVIWFFKDAEKDTVTGTVTARNRNILIVIDGNGDRFNIVFPRQWNIGSEVVSLDQVLNEGYVSIGEPVTLDVLKRTVTNENDVTVTIIFCYEITTNDYNLYAVLPVNIT